MTQIDTIPKNITGPDREAVARVLNTLQARLHEYDRACRLRGTIITSKQERITALEGQVDRLEQRIEGMKEQAAVPRHVDVPGEELQAARAMITDYQTILRKHLIDVAELLQAFPGPQPVAEADLSLAGVRINPSPDLSPANGEEIRAVDAGAARVAPGVEEPPAPAPAVKLVRTCAVPWCMSTKISARGLCGKHWYRNSHHGNPLLFYIQGTNKVLRRETGPGADDYEMVETRGA